MEYIIARLKEPSTWRGITAFLTGVGVTVSPELMAQIIAIGMGAAGLIGVLTADK